MLPEVHAEWTDAQSIISLCFSVFGISCTAITGFIFLKYRETPVVKSSTRELCYTMLVGMIMAHSIIFVVVSRPTIYTCATVKGLLPVSFAIIYGSLLVKTNRIARLLAMSKRKFPNLSLRFMSLQAQVTCYNRLESRFHANG